jgi:hypothetical protein
MNKPAYIVTSNAITVIWEGQPYTVNTDNPNYTGLKNALLNAEYDSIGRFLDIKKQIEDFSHGSIKVVAEKVYYGNYELKGFVIDKLLEFLRSGAKDAQPILNFIEKLMFNPSKNSVDQLYTFLSYKTLPLTETGNIIGYKGVDTNFYSKHGNKNKIVITGKGDLHIDNKTIEVKASAGKEVSSGGGRLGTPGFLNHQDVAQIIVKNMPKGFNLAAALAPGKGNLGLDGLVKLTSVLTAQKRAKLGRELFGSIFGNKADITKLVSALSSGQSIIKPYIKTNYEAYQKDSNFDGVMLMNFALGELRYYLKSEELADDVYNPAVYIISKKEADAARQILSQVTLRPFTEPPVEIPTFTKSSTTSKGQPTAKFQTDVLAFASEVARRAGIRDHKTITAIAQFTIAQFSQGVPGNKIMARLKAKFPQLVKKKAPTQMESMEINPDRPTREMVSVLRKKR